jgi:hypothetical protein
VSSGIAKILPVGNDLIVIHVECLPWNQTQRLSTTGPPAQNGGPLPPPPASIRTFFYSVRIGGEPPFSGNVLSFRALGQEFPIMTLDDLKTAIVQKYPKLQLSNENLRVFKVENGQEIEIVDSKQLRAFESSEDTPLIVKKLGETYYFLVVQ